MKARAAKRSSIRCKNNDHRCNKIEKRADEMLLASIRKCWYQTRSQVVPEVRNHRNEKTAVSAVVHPGVDHRRRSQAHVGCHRVSSTDIRQPTRQYHIPQVPGAPEKSDEDTRCKRTIAHLQPRLRKATPTGFRREQRTEDDEGQTAGAGK